jgi:hypothetical protein
MKMSSGGRLSRDAGDMAKVGYEVRKAGKTALYALVFKKILRTPVK